MLTQALSVGRRFAAGALFVAGALALLPSAEARPKKRGCPAGMVRVSGAVCIDAFEASLDVVDARGRTARRHSPYHTPAAGTRIRARSRRGVVPQAHVSQEQAAAACEAAGKRLCTDDEWLAACRSDGARTYPYGEEHVAGRCNDKGVSPLRTLHGKAEGLEVFGLEAMNDPRLNQIPGSLARTAAFKGCKTRAGAYDMVGNLHEWTADGSGTFRGGYYLDNEINGRGCSYVTKAHSTKYHDYSIGFRCCQGGGAAKTAKKAEHKPDAGKKTGKKRVHVVESGQTLSGIAARYGSAVASICDANGIDPKKPIVVGQELVIPD
jgi:hypothetical protein